MSGPLYNFQKVDSNKREENKNKFIQEYYNKLGFSKRYISPFEKEEIARNYNINKKDLEELINKSNKKFIDSISISISKDFDILLKSNEFFDDEFREKLKIDYHQGGYDFYDEIGCEDKINTKNSQYKSKILFNFKKEVDAYEFIDNEINNELKSKFNNFKYFGIEKSEFTYYIYMKNKLCKESKMSVIFDDFKKDLNYYEFIDEDIVNMLKLKYNNFDYKYSDESDFYGLIDEKNKNLIQSQSKKFLKDLNLYLDSNDNIIDNDSRLKLQSKYNKDYFDFYNKLNFDSKIDIHNEFMKPKIIQKELSCADGYITDSKLLGLKSKYDDKIFSWDNIVKNYNYAYENTKAGLEGLDSYYEYDFDFYKSRLMRNSTFKFGFQRTHIKNGVYYLFNYVSKAKRYGYNNNEIKLSLGAWKFKDGYEYAIDFFTGELIDAILNLSNDLIKDDNINYIALISVPPSKVYKNPDATMRKSIYRIKQYYDKYSNECDKEILDYGNLLYRFNDVPTSHLERQATYDEHLASIACTKKNLNHKNMAFVLLDDISTRGVIMKTCGDILVKHGADRKNIYKLAIFATGEWR